MLYADVCTISADVCWLSAVFAQIESLLKFLWAFNKHLIFTCIQEINLNLYVARLWTPYNQWHSIEFMNQLNFYLMTYWTYLFLTREVKFPPRRNKYTRGNTFRSVNVWGGEPGRMFKFTESLREIYTNWNGGNVTVQVGTDQIVTGCHGSLPVQDSRAGELLLN